MSGRAGDVVSGSLDASLARAEPQGTRPLAELVARLAAEGRLRSVVRDGSPIEPAELGPIDLAGVADDSRRVVPGALFVALPGDHVDGHDFAPAAQAAGAVGAIVERPIAGLDGVQLVVERSAAALATAAAWWYRDPSHELSVVGVTGTDGKTTTSFLAAAVLEAAGIPTGLVGTVETRVGPVRAAHAGPRHDARRASSSSDCSGRWSPPAIGRRSSRRPRTAWPPSGSAGSPTTPRCSRTCRTSISSSTARSRRTAPPSSACSSGSGPRARRSRSIGRGSASSTPTIPPRAASSRPPAPRTRGP